MYSILLLLISLKLNPIYTQYISDKFHHVEKKDSLLFCSTGRGLSIFNVKKIPPCLVSRIPTNGIAVSLAIYGKYVYVADYYNGVVIIDMANIEKPKIVGAINIHNNVQNIKIRNNIAYISAWDYGLYIYDVSSPLKPQFLSKLKVIGESTDIYLCDSFVYLGSFNTPMKKINVADLRNPILEDMYPLDSMCYGESIVIDDSIAYINCGYQNKNYIVFFAILNINNGNIISTLNIPATNMGLFKYGDYLYSNTQDSGICIIDVKNPLNPTIIGRVMDNYGFGTNFIVDSNILYRPKADYGFSITDITDPQNPQIIYKYENIQWKNFTFKDSMNQIYLLGYKNGTNIHDNKSIIKILDIRDPLNIQSRGEIEFSGQANLYEGSFSYPYLTVAMNDDNLSDENLYTLILDVSNNKSIKIVDTVAFGGVNNLRLPYLYVLDQKILRIININNKNNVDSLNLPDFGFNMVIRDSIIYITSPNFLMVYNINSHSLLEKYYHGHPYAVNITEIYPYLAIPYTPHPGSTYGFMLFDISNNCFPVLIKDTLIEAPPVYPECICIMGCELMNNYLFMARGHYGIDGWKINLSKSIHYEGTWETPYLATHNWPPGNSNIHIHDNEFLFYIDWGSLECFEIKP